jgi:predicted nicotinamide N-methyase
LVTYRGPLINLVPCVIIILAAQKSDLEFKVAEHQLRIGTQQFTVLSVTNFDELYEQLVEKGLEHEDVADERIPYWAELWPSAVALATHLALHTDLVKGKQVLEIGGGLGLPSLVAASLGASVTATDYLQDAVDFAIRNALLNGIADMRFETFDWRKAEGHNKYDVLLASDVAYERSQFEYLDKAFEHLVKPNGIILLSEPNRYIAEPFLNGLAESGYSLIKYEYEVEVKGIKSKASVYEIRRPKIG